MAKLFIILILLIFSFNINAADYDPYNSKLDAIHFLMKIGINSNKHETWPHSKHNRKIYDNVEPFKLKYCKLRNSGQTFTVLSNQNCSYWGDDESSTKKIKPKKGKKISKKEYIISNPDFSEQNNLICIDLRRSSIYFLTHTKSNNIYLNSLALIKYFDYWKLGTTWYKTSGKTGKDETIVMDNFPITLEDVNEKQKWRHQGISFKERDGYTFTFFKYIDKQIDRPWAGQNGYPVTLSLKPSIEEKDNAQCYADDEYWTAMYPNKNQEKIKEEKRIAVVETEKKEEKKEPQNKIDDESKIILKELDQLIIDYSEDKISIEEEKYCKTNEGNVYKSLNPCSGTVEISKSEYEKRIADPKKKEEFGKYCIAPKDNEKIISKSDSCGSKMREISKEEFEDENYVFKLRKGDNFCRGIEYYTNYVLYYISLEEDYRCRNTDTHSDIEITKNEFCFDDTIFGGYKEVCESDITSETPKEDKKLTIEPFSKPEF